MGVLLMTHFDFYSSNEYQNLYQALEQAYSEMDVETGIDILIDIEDAKKEYDNNLPDWYNIIWNTDPLNVSSDVLKSAWDDYWKDIKNRA